MEPSRVPSRVEDESTKEEDFFSDESSFYGDDEMKASFERRAASYDPAEFWRYHHQSVQYIMAQNSLKAPEVETQTPESRVNNEQSQKSLPSSDKVDTREEDAPVLPSLPTEPYNLYEGNEMARQLSEPISAFLKRLQPSITTIGSGPWIWIANPATSHRFTTSDTDGFMEEGSDLLEEYMRRKRSVEEANPNKFPGVITRMLKPDRERLEQSIISLAKKKNVRGGKWMLFPYPSELDSVWARVATATLEGTLGFAAKVATDAGDEKARLICIYTEDAEDKTDLKRALMEIKRLKLVGKGYGDKPIYYKRDAYTYLGIMSDNEYKLKASTYSSRDVFKEMEPPGSSFGR